MTTTETTRTSVGAQTSSFGEFFKIWLKIGCINFGGPAGQIAMMHRIVVDEKKWIEESRFLHALNFCMLLPGPEAQKLATYIGWLLHGDRKSTRLNSSHSSISYAVFCLKKKTNTTTKNRKR